MRLVISAGENKTVCFDFSRHGQLRDGEEISNPVVLASPDGDLNIGTPAVLTATFYDSDGKNVLTGKGVKVRIDASGGVVGTDYRVICRVDTEGGDVIEEDHTIRVKSTLP